MLSTPKIFRVANRASVPYQLPIPALSHARCSRVPVRTARPAITREGARDYRGGWRCVRESPSVLLARPTFLCPTHLTGTDRMIPTNVGGDPRPFVHVGPESGGRGVKRLLRTEDNLRRRSCSRKRENHPHEHEYNSHLETPRTGVLGHEGTRHQRVQTLGVHLRLQKVQQFLRAGGRGVRVCVFVVRIYANSRRGPRSRLWCSIVCARSCRVRVRCTMSFARSGLRVSFPTSATRPNNTKMAGEKNIRNVM